jgi:hypothetical protein
MADVLLTYDYYPYHSIMPGRNFNSTEYRYGGANGQEKDDEISGAGNSYTAMYWQYSPRPVMRWNLDPKPNPSISPYAVYAGNPIYNVDIYGDSIGVPKNLFNEDGINQEAWNTFSQGVYDVTGITLNQPSEGDRTLTIGSTDNSVGSKTARSVYDRALTDKGVINTEFVFSDANVDGAVWSGAHAMLPDGSKGPLVLDKSVLKIDIDDINSIKYANVDKRSFGIGLIAGHELIHRYGLGDNVTLSNPRGATVDFINKARAEMGMGLRLTYAPHESSKFTGKNWILEFGEINSDGSKVRTGGVFLPFSLGQ